MFQTKASREKWTAWGVWIAIGVSGLSALFTGWQAYEAHRAADREDGPMVRVGIVSQALPGFPKKTNEMFIEVTNLGPQTMHVKSITLYGWKRVWTIHAPTDKQPTLPLEKGVGFTKRIEWDYAKYPLLSEGELSLSLPEDFFVEVETTRAVHRRHIDIGSITYIF